MENLIKKIFKDNFMISLPSLIISVFLIMFLIIGLSTKESTLVDYDTSLIENQKIIENSYLSVDLSTSLATIDDPHVILNPYQISPLSALIIFSSETEDKIKIVVKGKTEAADFEYITNASIEHYIPIYGLYPEYNNIVEMSYVNSEDTTIYNIEIETSPLPSSIALPTGIETTYEYFGDNLMLFNSPMTGPVGYDYNGDVRWYLTENLFYSVDVLSNNRLLLGTERSQFESNNKIGLYEMDFLGKIYTEYSLPNGYTGNFLELDNSNLLISSSSEENGYDDTIIELSREFGFAIRTIDISNIFNSETGANNLWNVNKKLDITGIEYDLNTDSIFISLKALDVILNVDYKTFNLNYVIGDPNNVEEELVDAYFLNPVGDNFEWQYAQGDIEVLDNGDLLVFDNGYLRSKTDDEAINIINSYSRGVVFTVDESNMTIEQVWDYGKILGTNFYSLYSGSVNAYSQNNYMLHSGNINLINTVPLNDYPAFYDGPADLTQKSITYEILDNDVMYSIGFDVNYSEASKVDITKNIDFTFETTSVGRFQFTPFKSNTLNNQMDIFDKIPKKYGVTIVEEKDRLVVTGYFNPDDEVYILLENNLMSKRYEVPTTKDYLSNIFNKNYLDDPINFYINSTGVTNEYDIYLVINQKLYNSYNKINFND